LPETLRLAWLLSQLNLDVPAFSENIAPQRLDLAAALAMIPVALTAAENLKLASATDEAIAQAAQTWLAPNDRGEGRIDILTQWWSAYKGRRPHWSAALEALDRLLSD